MAESRGHHQHHHENRRNNYNKDQLKIYREMAPETLSDKELNDLIKRNGNDADIRKAISALWNDIPDDRAVIGNTEWQQTGKKSKKKDTPPPQSERSGGRGRGRSVPPGRGGPGSDNRGGRGGQSGRSSSVNSSAGRGNHTAPPAAGSNAAAPVKNSTNTNNSRSGSSSLVSAWEKPLNTSVLTNEVQVEEVVTENVTSIEIMEENESIKMVSTVVEETVTNMSSWGKADGSQEAPVTTAPVTLPGNAWGAGGLSFAQKLKIAEDKKNQPPPKVAPVKKSSPKAEESGQSQSDAAGAGLGLGKGGKKQTRTRKGDKGKSKHDTTSSAAPRESSATNAETQQETESGVVDSIAVDAITALSLNGSSDVNVNVAVLDVSRSNSDVVSASVDQSSKQESTDKAPSTMNNNDASTYGSLKMPKWDTPPTDAGRSFQFGSFGNLGDETPAEEKNTTQHESEAPIAVAAADLAWNAASAAPVSVSNDGANDSGYDAYHQQQSQNKQQQSHNDNAQQQTPAQQQDRGAGAGVPPGLALDVNKGSNQQHGQQGQGHRGQNRRNDHQQQQQQQYQQQHYYQGMGAPPGMQQQPQGQNTNQTPGAGARGGNQQGQAAGAVGGGVPSPSMGYGMGGYGFDGQQAQTQAQQQVSGQQASSYGYGQQPGIPSPGTGAAGTNAVPGVVANATPTSANTTGNTSGNVAGSSPAQGNAQQQNQAGFSNQPPGMPQQMGGPYPPQYYQYYPNQPYYPYNHSGQNYYPRGQGMFPTPRGPYGADPYSVPGQYPGDIYSQSGQPYDPAYGQMAMHQHAHIGQGGGQGAGNDGGRTNNKNPKNQTNAAQQGGGQGGGVSHNSSQGDAAHGQYANYANPYNMRDQQGMWQYGAAGQWGGQQNMQFQQQGVSPSPGVGYGSGVAQQGGNPSRQANGSYRGGNPSGSGGNAAAGPATGGSQANWMN